MPPEEAGQALAELAATNPEAVTAIIEAAAEDPVVQAAIIARVVVAITANPVAMSTAFLNTSADVRVGVLEEAAQDEEATQAVAQALQEAIEEAPEAASVVAESLLAMEDVADAGAVLGALAVSNIAAASEIVQATIVELDDPQAAADLGVEAARSTETIQAVTEAFEQLDPETFETVVQHLPPDVVAPHDSPEPGEQGWVITFGEPTSGLFGSGDLLISLGGRLSPAPIERILTRYARPSLRPG